MDKNGYMGSNSADTHHLTRWIMRIRDLQCPDFDASCFCLLKSLLITANHLCGEGIHAVHICV